MIDIVRVWNPGILSPYMLEQVCGHIVSGLEHSLGEDDLESIIEQIKLENAQLWLVLDNGLIVGSYTTQVIDYPRLSTLRIVTLAGQNMDEWIKQAYDSLVAFAHETKASRIDLVGRKGWIRRLAPLGFVEAYTVVIKEIK